MSHLYAHTPPKGEGWQAGHLLTDHLMAVADAARSNASPFGAGDLAYYLGLWHDVGKSSPAFQEYLRLCHADAECLVSGPDHKAAGAVLAMRYLQPLSLLIQGHHGGLRSPNACNTWLAARQSHAASSGTADIEAAIAHIQSLLPHILPTTPLHAPSFVRDAYDAEFFLRMLFSALVDADFLDTESHFSPNTSVQRDKRVSFDTLVARFMRKQTAASGQFRDPVAQMRHTLYEACLSAANLPPGLFRLAIPTGGGKTRSAMAFALQHASRHQLRRIIVAVPFITITEQTAAVYRAMFEAEGDTVPVVVEHHSGGRRQEPESDAAGETWLRLASENWDAPIVVTTTVQLFESLFANQTGRCRKLHRLASSVIILDEAQSLPPTLLRPILDSLRQLCANYGATVVLSTATQPAFESIPEFASLVATDIVPNAGQWFTATQRVTYDWRHEQPLLWPDVARLMQGEQQALTLVNTKSDALTLLEQLGADALHLSTLLCGAHRRDVLAEVQRRLHAGEPCRLVATQVVEAGVDIDFPLVLRAMAPFDSIIQAAGRCNREGRKHRGQVIVFTPAEGGMPSGTYRTATQTTLALLRAGTLDPGNPEDVRRYFRRLYQNVNLDGCHIQQVRTQLDYVEVASRFRMIDNDTHGVVIRYGDAATQKMIEQHIQSLRLQLPKARAVLRQLQPYMVSMQVGKWRRFADKGLISELLPELGVWNGGYDQRRGLVAD